MFFYWHEEAFRDTVSSLRTGSLRNRFSKERCTFTLTFIETVDSLQTLTLWFHSHIYLCTYVLCLNRSHRFDMVAGCLQGSILCFQREGTEPSYLAWKVCQGRGENCRSLSPHRQLRGKEQRFCGTHMSAHEPSGNNPAHPCMSLQTMAMCRTHAQQCGPWSWQAKINQSSYSWRVRRLFFCIRNWRDQTGETLSFDWLSWNI